MKTKTSSRSSIGGCSNNNNGISGRISSNCAGCIGYRNSSSSSTSSCVGGCCGCSSGSGVSSSLLIKICNLCSQIKIYNNLKVINVENTILAWNI